MLFLATSTVSVLFGATCTATDRRFPPNFKFGAATSAYQIEGSWNVSDKSESMWDRFVHKVPSSIKNKDNADIACDSYRKVKEDIQMTADLGLDYYRISLSWPRLLPEGFSNVVSETGKKHYSDLIDGLLEKGVEPLVTIYHWDLPQRLQDLGGWTNPMITDWFADYARVVFSLYGDRVKTWITVNEPIVMCDASYNTAEFGPGIKDTFASYICGKHTVVAHAKAWRIYDKEFRQKQKGRVSISNQLIWYEAESPEYEEFAEITRELSAGLYSHPIYSKQGGWPPKLEDFIAKKSKEKGYARSRLPAFTLEEIELVKGAFDFYALNYYSAGLVREAKHGEEVGPWPIYGAPEFGALRIFPPEWRPTANPFMKVYLKSISANYKAEVTKEEGYLLLRRPNKLHQAIPMRVYPKGLRKQLVWLKENYGDLEYVITENGFASNGLNLDDPERIKYIEEHLEQVLLAIKEDGVNVTAYTVWALMDNFEWGDGFSLRYGLYEVDFNDPRRPRTPRASARWYSAVIKNHSLDVSYKTEEKKSTYSF